MAKAVSLSNGRAWKSKKDAKAHFKEILGRYADGDTVSRTEDHEDLISLLERFDALVADVAPKLGAGVAHFERRLNRGDGWSSPGFWAVRSDGSATDFSYIKAIDGVPKPQSQEFYDACHNAVSKDLLRFKQLQFAQSPAAGELIECDITGKFISYAESNLSHAEPSFVEIVNEYRRLKGWGIDIPAGILSVPADRQLSSHFSSDIDAEEFRELHHRLAVLRIVAKSLPTGSRTTAPVRRPLKFNL